MDTKNPFIMISDEQIVRLVDSFYERIEKHPELGPIFITAIGNDWQPHLNKMYDFWSSVLNTTGRYNGRPMPVHFALKDQIKRENFINWLQLFQQSANEILSEQQVNYLMDKALRIANSFHQGIFFDPGDPADFRPLEI
jgi:hemoglobin